MDTRKKLIICTAACLMAAGAVTAQDHISGTPGILNADPGTPVVEYDRVAAADVGSLTSIPSAQSRESRRFSRYLDRFFPTSGNTSFNGPDSVEQPGVAPTTEILMKRVAID